MDHIVYVDAKAKELESLINGKKTMIIRGAAGRKLPYGRVNIGDSLYFIRNNAEGLVQARANVINVYNSEKLTPEESSSLLEKYQDKLQLSEKQRERWNGKRYLVLVSVEDIQQVEPFKIDRSQYGNMDDWLLVGNISDVKIE